MHGGGRWYPPAGRLRHTPGTVDCVGKAPTCSESGHRDTGPGRRAEHPLIDCGEHRRSRQPGWQRAGADVTSGTRCCSAAVRPTQARRRAREDVLVQRDMGQSPRRAARIDGGPREERGTAVIVRCDGRSVDLSVEQLQGPPHQGECLGIVRLRRASDDLLCAIDQVAALFGRRARSAGAISRICRPRGPGHECTHRRPRRRPAVTPGGGARATVADVEARRHRVDDHIGRLVAHVDVDRPILLVIGNDVRQGAFRGELEPRPRAIVEDLDRGRSIRTDDAVAEVELRELAARPGMPRQDADRRPDRACECPRSSLDQHGLILCAG